MIIHLRSRSFSIIKGSWHVYNYNFSPYSHKYGIFHPLVIEARPEFINYIKRVR